LSGWIDQAKRAELKSTAVALGYEFKAPGITPCPACKTEQRGGADRRAPVGFTPDGMGWRCHRCQAGGGVVQLVAYALTGTAKPSDWAPVRQWFIDAGLVDSPGGRGPGAINRPSKPVVKATPATPAPPAPPKRIDPEALAAVWNRALPVDQDEAAAGWLKSKKIDPSKVVDFDLARVIHNLTRPSWAMVRGAVWQYSGHRLLVPFYDHAGNLASVQGRFIGTTLPAGMPKGASPAGAEIRGLVMADELGRMILQGVNREAWPKPLRIVITEGVPDFLTTATGWGESAENVPAVYGIVAGSWSQEIAERIPPESVVIIATDHDPGLFKAGEIYFLKIAQTLKHCQLERMLING